MLSWTFVVRRFWSNMLKCLISTWHKRLISKGFSAGFNTHVECIQILNTGWMSMFILLMFIIKFISYIIRCSIHILQWFPIIYGIHLFTFEISIVLLFCFKILFYWIFLLQLPTNTNSWVVIQSQNGFTIYAIGYSPNFLNWSFWLLTITF